MTTFHAVVWVDHHNAQILQFDAEHVQAQKARAHTHHTRQHGSSVRTEHEFFGGVCDAVAGIAELLVVGPKTGLADFRHYVDKHRPEVAKRIAGWEAHDHASDKQLVALARDFFVRHDRMNGTPTPS